MERTTSFGYWLRRRRKALDLTQDELARQVGCAVGTIKKIEGDERRPSKQLAERLADLLAISLEERPAFLKAARAEQVTDELDIAAQPLDSSISTVQAAALPNGTVTFLFTDIEDSTKLWAERSEAMRTALARHDALLRQAIEAHGGMVFKTVGDSCYAAFSTAAAALAAALAAQRDLTAEAWNTAGPFRVRMALHTGVAEARAGDYFGHTLNRVARLLTAGHGSQVLLSAATWELVRDHLPPDVALRDLGAHWLKSLARPEQIYQLAAPGLPADFPPLHTLDRPTTNLPAQTTAFIGREREVAAVRDLLRRADVRLVTLTGPGGAGKTRLGLHVAGELLDDCPDGVWFVNLASLSDPGLVAATIAQTFSLREIGGQPIQAILNSYLRAKRLLMLLDNFEQITEAGPLISELLAAAPGLTVLVTSRAPLHLSGEREYAVPPLGLPPLEHSSVQTFERSNVRTLTQYAAVRLFIERAQAVKADFAMTNENAPAVAEICYRLDGLPLAIELAAARIKLFPPQALLRRLGNRLTLLTGGAHDLPARQQTIRNTIDWSYQLLDAGEQTLFARLAVFVGGCTLAAAETVCDTGGDLPFDVTDGLAALLDQSLLRQEEGVDGEPRYTMLETIREYALEQMEQRGVADVLRRRHAEYYLVLTETAGPKLRSAEQRVWLDLLESEHDNLRAALIWSRATNEIVSSLRLVGLLFRFWNLRGYYSEGRRWITDILAHANMSERTVDLAWALTGAAELAWLQGDIALAESQIDEIPTLWQELGDKRGLAYALDSLANVCWPLGQIARGRAMLEESLRLFEELEDSWDIAQELSGLGNFYQWQRDYSKAHSFLEKALRIARAEGFSWITAHALMGLGHLARAQRKIVAARNYYEESLAIYRAIGEQGMISQLLYSLSSIALLQEDLATSTAFAEEAQKLFRSLGDHLSLTEILNRFGDIARSQNNFERAVYYYSESLILCHQTENVLLPPTIHANLGYIALHQGDLAQATLQFTESLTLLRQLSFTPYDDVVLGFVGFAAVAMQQGRSECAARLLGAVEALGDPLIIGLIPAVCADHDRVLTATRAQFDEATFAAAWAAGRALTLEQAIAEALAAGDATTGGRFSSRSV